MRARAKRLRYAFLITGVCTGVVGGLAATGNQPILWGLAGILLAGSLLLGLGLFLLGRAEANE